MSLKLGLMLISVSLVSVAGCKHNKEGAGSNLANPQPAACPAGQVWNGQACVAQSAPPTTTPPPDGPANPNTPSPIPVNNGGPKATPLDGASSGVATQALDVLAKQSAPGAKAVPGTVLAGQFQQGPTLEMTFQAQPGNCYTL